MAILIILGLTSKNQVNNVSYSFTCFYSNVSNTVFFFLIATTARPHISDEQLGFIQRVLEIPLDQRKCWDLINLGGPDPSPEARKLGKYSHRRKWILYITFSIDVFVFPNVCGFIS